MSVKVTIEEEGEPTVSMFTLSLEDVYSILDPETIRMARLPSRDADDE